VKLRAPPIWRERSNSQRKRELIVGDYAKAARAIAETLARLATIETQLRALNARLPTYIGGLQIAAFLGNRATLGETVVLPPSAQTIRPFGQRDLDAIRLTSFTRGTDCAEGRPQQSFDPTRQSLVAPARIASVEL
jgi:hypothetical protein